jgi:hypothetical protein
MKRIFPLIAMVTLKDTTITVDTPDGKSQTVVLTPDTKYTRTDTAITPKDIKLGDQVVIQATKKDDQLTAVKVKAVRVEQRTTEVNQP